MFAPTHHTYSANFNSAFSGVTPYILVGNTDTFTTVRLSNQINTAAGERDFSAKEILGMGLGYVRLCLLLLLLLLFGCTTVQCTEAGSVWGNKCPFSAPNSALKGFKTPRSTWFISVLYSRRHHVPPKGRGVPFDTAYRPSSIATA